LSGFPQQESAVTSGKFVGITLLAAGSAASGWLIGSQSHDARLERQGSSPSTIVPTNAEGVKVFSDGTVSVQISRVGVNWLLAEIARQQGRLPASARTLAGVPEMIPVAETNSSNEGDPSAADSRESERVLQALREGNEAEREAALREAATAGVELPTETLQQLVDTDPSARVRLHAYSAYLDSASNDATAFSAALAVGHNSPSSEVRAEARKRQDEFDALQRVQASAIQQ
jgi:hypothetical protein